jgi:hypothetical protein
MYLFIAENNYGEACVYFSEENNEAMNIAQKAIQEWCGESEIIELKNDQNLIDGSFYQGIKDNECILYVIRFDETKDMASISSTISLKTANPFKPKKKTKKASK